MKQRFISKKIILAAAVSLVVVIIGILYVAIGSHVLQEVPKTEVAQASPNPSVQPLSHAEPVAAQQQVEPLPEPSPQPTPQATAPASAAPATPQTSDEKPKASSSLNKRLRKLVSLLPGSNE